MSMRREHPVIVAHRGASGTAPENTLAAFRRALELGSPAVELDVHRTADGELVVLHDAKVDRTTNGQGVVSEMTLAQIRELDAGAWRGPEFAGERIPTLAEVCRLVKGRALLFVEIKDEGISPEVLAVLDAERMGAGAVAISFSAGNIRALKAARPQQPAGFLTGRAEDLALAEELHADALCLHFPAASPELAEATHARGLALSVWTANDPDDIRRLAALGADYITSDFPERALAVLAG